ncbi:hypothetical protein BSKO_12849 [Bryopsis sp. KO-2023]|nr:hypothetical protein BSKO_12849 [Bryopsis sp. KO-2023]
MRRPLGWWYLALGLGILAVAALGSQETDGDFLQFNGDGAFKIVQFSDLHFGDSPLEDQKTGQAMLQILRVEKDVDLVVLAGDMISGYACPYKQNTMKSLAKRKEWFRSMWSQVISPLQKRKVKYASTLGNHDSSQIKRIRKRIVEMDMRSGKGFSLTQPGPENITGVSNYFLPVRSSNTSQESARLWFFDSMAKGCNGLHYSWGCVGEDTVHWFDHLASKQSPLPGAAFIHIPLPEFLDGWRFNNGTATGGKFEPVSCPRANTHLFDKLRLHGVSSVYSGHDHLNDYYLEFKGVRLAYGRKSGYGAYGPSGLAGARVIILKEGQPTKNAETYIRFGDGSRDDQPERKSSIKGFQFRCAAGPYVGDLPGTKLRSTSSGMSLPYNGSSLALTLLISFVAMFGLILWRRVRRPKKLRGA